MVKRVKNKRLLRSIISIWGNVQILLWGLWKIRSWNVSQASNFNFSREVFPYLKWRIHFVWWESILFLMFSRISYYSLNWFLSYWSKITRRHRQGLMILIVWNVVWMVSHIALRSPFAIIKLFPSVIFLSFHLLRRAPFHDTSILIIIVHGHRWGMSISLLLLLVVVIVIILRQWRGHVITMMVRIRWWRGISIIIVVWLRMMLPPLILIHVRVLIWRCWRRKLLILEWLILIIIVRTIKLHPCIIGWCVGCWSGCSEPTRAKISVIELRILLTLTSMHSCRCCSRRTKISGVTFLLSILFLCKIQCVVLILQIRQLDLSQRRPLFVFKSLSFTLLERRWRLLIAPHLLCSLWMV